MELKGSAGLSCVKHLVFKMERVFRKYLNILKSSRNKNVLEKIMLNWLVQVLVKFSQINSEWIHVRMANVKIKFSKD